MNTKISLLEAEVIDIKNSQKTKINRLKEGDDDVDKSKYDLIVVTDVFEVTDDIFKFLNALNSILNNNGKLIINSINPRWNFLLSIFEIL